jgi:serine/threonine-protein kinase
LIVMEWLPAGALKRWLGRRDREFLWPVRRWFVPLCRAVERVHERGFVHADLKPANVLFRGPDDPVLSDFGLAHPVGERVGGGSRGYLSPERLSGAPASPADDVYALGRLLEDALSALDLDPEQSAPIRRLAERAMGPVEGRPEGAAAFAQQIAAASQGPA